MPKTGINLYKRKDGRWEGRYIKGYKENGNAAYGYVYAKTYLEAKRKLMIATVVLPSNTRGAGLLFSDLSGRWLFNASLRVKPSSQANYSAALQNHILPAIGGVKISNLNAEMIDQLASDLLAHGRKDGKGGLSSKTVRDILSVIKSVLDYAKNEWSVGTSLKITYPKCAKQSIRVLSQQEQRSLEHILLNDPDITKLGILLSLYTGLRLGEVCALRWQDISIENHMVSVRQTMQRIKNINTGEVEKTTLIIGTPKSLHSERDVPLPKFLAAYMARFIKDSNSFFLSSTAFAYIEPRTLQNHFRRNITRAGIASANYHSLRHTFATRCIEAGVDIKSLSEMLGHSNVNITLNRYVHSSFEQKRDGMSKLEHFSGFAIL